MILALREEFNSKFSPNKYDEVKRVLEARSGCAIQFRIAETPLFIDQRLATEAARLAEQLLLYSSSSELQRLGQTAIPTQFNIPTESGHPTFAAVDFAICGSSEAPELKLIELQGFPSLFYFQALYSQTVREVYDLPGQLTGLVDASFDYPKYYEMLQRVIVGQEDPAHVVLLELDPYEQKTLPDFLLTQKHLGIQICNVRDLVQRGRKLYYRNNSELVEIRRIYNRTIYDELKAKDVRPSVDLTDQLDLTWIGHPNWYYRISKILLPELSKRFEVTPRGYLLSELPFDPNSVDLEAYVLKPLYSFAGSGVIVGPSAHDIRQIPSDQHDQWMLQERVTYADVITTPDGYGVKAEVRILLIWPDDSAPRALHTLVRLTRGKMVGVDHNKGLDWVGSSCALIG
jgi:hypothetical protein